MLIFIMLNFRYAECHGAFYGVNILSIMTPSKMTFSIMTLSIPIYSIMILSIRDLFVTPNIDALNEVSMIYILVFLFLFICECAGQNL